MNEHFHATHSHYVYTYVYIVYNIHIVYSIIHNFLWIVHELHTEKYGKIPAKYNKSERERQENQTQWKEDEKLFHVSSFFDFSFFFLFIL